MRGGGGVFRGIWSASGFAKAGLTIEDTAVPGRIYGFSCEHHMRNEVQLHSISGWRIEALQTEEETEQGRDAISLEARDAKDVIFANLFQYRVSRSVGPADHATEIGQNASLEFANVHVFAGGRYAFDNSMLDLRTGVRTRVRDFASMGTVTPLVKPVAFSAWRGAKLQVLASGFQDVTGVIAEADGNVLFTDAVAHRLLRWERATRLVKELDVPAGFRPVVAVSSERGFVTVLGADNRLLELAPDGAARDVATAAIPPMLASVCRPVAIAILQQLSPYRTPRGASTLEEMLAGCHRPRTCDRCSTPRSLQRCCRGRRSCRLWRMALASSGSPQTVHTFPLPKLAAHRSRQGRLARVTWLASSCWSWIVRGGKSALSQSRNAQRQSLPGATERSM